MVKIKQFIAFLQSKNETLNKLVPWFLMFYFVLVCFPYIFARISFLNNIFSNSVIAYIFRFAFLAIYTLFGLFLMISNKLKINWAFFIASFLLLILFTIIIFASPDSIVSYSLFYSGKISISSISIGVFSKLVHIARFGGDLVFFFFLLNCYPFCLKNRNNFTYIVLPAVVIGVIGVVYTLVFERNNLIAVINGSANPETLCSIFHSKNAYGIFLFNGAVASMFIFFSDTRRWFKLIGLVIPIFFAMSYIINCKLAAVCILIMLILTYVYIIVRYIKTRPYISYVFSGVALLVSLGITLIFAIPQLHESGISGSIYNKIMDAIKNINIGSFIGRTTEWEMVPRMTNGIYTLTGFSVITGYYLIIAYTSINGSTATPLYDLHNAYIDFYAYHGILGCVLLGLLYFYVGYLIYKLFKKNKSLAFMIIIIFIVSILFGMAETYTLFISMSANTFALSMMILGVLLFELKDDDTMWTYDSLLKKLFKRKPKEVIENE